MYWEEFEAGLSHVYSAFCAPDRFNEAAMRKYGEPLNFVQRLKGLKTKGDDYFRRRPHQAKEGDFDSLVNLAENFSQRRNDIAHGVPRYIHWILDPNSPVTWLELAPKIAWCVIPPHFKGNKFTKARQPAYVFTSREINYFAGHFWKLIQASARLAHDIERIRATSP